MTSQPCQRWNSGRAFYRPAGEVIDTTRFEVTPATENDAKRFTQEHHYSRSYPAARYRVALMHKRPFQREEMAGVAVFSVPMNNHVVPHYFGIPAINGVELGRFVIRQDVPANGETWFLARAIRLLKESIPGISAVVSYSDPLPRRTITGDVVKPGHVGTIYQASNCAYLGRSRARSLVLTPAGTVLNERTVSKIRNDERGREYAYEQLLELGAPKRLPGESGASYVARLMKMPELRRVRHNGNHVYGFVLGHNTAAKTIRKRLLSKPYPKKPDSE